MKRIGGYKVNFFFKIFGMPYQTAAITGVGSEDWPAVGIGACDCKGSMMLTTTASPLTCLFRTRPFASQSQARPFLSVNGGFAIETVVTLVRRSVDQLPAVTPSGADYGYGSQPHDGLA